MTITCETCETTQPKHNMIDERCSGCYRSAFIKSVKKAEYLVDRFSTGFCNFKTMKRTCKELSLSIPKHANKTKLWNVMNNYLIETNNPKASVDMTVTGHRI